MNRIENAEFIHMFIWFLSKIIYNYRQLYKMQLGQLPKHAGNIFIYESNALIYCNITEKGKQNNL